jgi:hypothetical protein
MKTLTKFLLGGKLHATSSTYLTKPN